MASSMWAPGLDAPNAAVSALTYNTSPEFLGQSLDLALNGHTRK
jgi:hypothetical protein